MLDQLSIDVFGSLGETVEKMIPLLFTFSVDKPIRISLGEPK